MDEAGKRLRDLAREARDGNRQAFDLLIGRYQTRVMKTALYLTRNLADAEDVAQEVYIKIFRRLPQFKTVRELDGWIYRVTVNAARDAHRRRRIWSPLKELFAAEPSADPVLRREIRNRLLEALSGLSFNERATFIFKELHELPTGEVALILGRKEGTIRSYLHGARKKLRKSLGEFRKHR